MAFHWRDCRAHAIHVYGKRAYDPHMNLGSYLRRLQLNSLNMDHCIFDASFLPVCFVVLWLWPPSDLVLLPVVLLGQ
eukprot:4022556-Pyramimonas_sp.AAC.1